MQVEMSSTHINLIPNKMIDSICIFYVDIQVLLHRVTICSGSTYLIISGSFKNTTEQQVDIDIAYIVLYMHQVDQHQLTPMPELYSILPSASDGLEHKVNPPLQH